MKKIYLVIALIVAVVVFYLAFSQQWSGKWQVYKNARYDFTVEYPPKWDLGVAPENNDGREFSSPDGNILCHAYGYANSLMNVQGDPQTLDEFIDWLVNDGEAPRKVIEQSNTTLSGEPAIELVSVDAGVVSHAIYTMDEESGRALACYFEDVQAQEEFADFFQRMAGSFSISGVSSDDEFAGQLTMCANMTNGVTTPLKDKETFLDENYTEVTITSRDAWDIKRLPAQVTSLEKNGYSCFPMPFEIEEEDLSVGMNIQPAVISVQWDCELEYDDYSFVDAGASLAKKQLEGQGYVCEKQECIDDSEKESFVWLCSQ